MILRKIKVDNSVKCKAQSEQMQSISRDINLNTKKNTSLPKK